MLQPQILPFNNLRGINTKKSVTQRAANEANTANSGYFNKTGAFIKSRGFRRLNETEIGSSIDLDSIYQFNDEVIVAGGTDLISYDLNSTSETVLDSGITGTFYDFEEILPYQTNYLVGVNGNDPAFKYDGTTKTNLSISTPLTSPTAAPSVGGSLTPSATYQLAITYLRDNGSGELQESNPCDTVTVTLGGADTRIALSAIPVSPDAQVTNKRVYLSRPNGAILFLQGTIAAAATTYNIDTEVDVLEDSELEYDHDPAPDCYLIEKYKNVVCLAGDPEFQQRFYFSQDGQPWYFPQGQLDESIINYFDIGEIITSIKSYYDFVFIFGLKGNIFLFQGNSVAGYSLVQIKNDERVTALSDRATLVQDNWCYFLSYDGYYRTNGQIIQQMSYPISAYFDPENQQDSQYNVSGFDYGFNKIVPVAVYYKPNNQILLWITGTGQLDYVNNICFALHLTNIIADDSDLLEPNYSVYINRATRCTSLYIKDNVAKYFLVAQNNGFIFEAEKGRYDGAAVNSVVTSATTTTLTDSTQTWTVNTYVQLWVYIRAGSGIGQSRLILSNTATELTIDHAWDSVPDSSTEYSIGAIPYTYIHSYNNYGNNSLSKCLIYIRPLIVSEGDATVIISFGYDFINVDSADYDPRIISVAGDSLWDVSLWDVAKWDGPTVVDELISGAASRVHRWATIKVTNLLADQSVEYDGHDKLYQMEGVR